MEAPPKVHRHYKHRRTCSRHHHKQNITIEGPSSSTNLPTNKNLLSSAASIGYSSKTSVTRTSAQSQHHYHYSHNSTDTTTITASANYSTDASLHKDKSAKYDHGSIIPTVVTNTSADIETNKKLHERYLNKSTLGLMDRELKTTGSEKKFQTLSDPQASPAQRSYSRNSFDKSPRRKRSKSESRRRRERKLIAAGEMEVRQANETLMRYLKQCSEMNDSSLSGELEIDHSFDERKVHRKTRSQRDRKGHLQKKSGTGLSSIPKDLSDDIVPAVGEIYNPFTPVISPTEGPPSRRNKMFIQTPSGYCAVDNFFYKNSIESDPESNKSKIVTIVNLSCAIQRIWIMVSNICHGLLGGLALAHLLFLVTARPHDWAYEAIGNYSSFAEIYANAFYCLVIVCMVSLFDRMDIGYIELTNTSVISFRWIIISMIYIATVFLTLCAETIDEKLRFTNFNVAVLQVEMDNDQVIGVWNSLSIARSIAAICGWIMIGLSPTGDLLYSYLIEMKSIDK